MPHPQYYHLGTFALLTGPQTVCVYMRMYVIRHTYMAHDWARFQLDGITIDFYYVMKVTWYTYLAYW